MGRGLVQDYAYFSKDANVIYILKFRGECLKNLSGKLLNTVFTA